MLVVLVGLEVLGEIGNPLGEDCDLHLGRARVTVTDIVYLLFWGVVRRKPGCRPARSRQERAFRGNAENLQDILAI